MYLNTYTDPLAFDLSIGIQLAMFLANTSTNLAGRDSRWWFVDISLVTRAGARRREQGPSLSLSLILSNIIILDDEDDDKHISRVSLWHLSEL